MSTANRVIKNTGFLYTKMCITMFISLYITRLVLNALGEKDFGVFNVVGGAIAMLGFLNAAMAGATQRFMSFSEGEGDKEKQKKIFNISVVLHFFIALLLGVGLLIAGYFFFNGLLNIDANRLGAAKVVYGSLIVSTMFTVMTVPYDAVLNARENMKYYAIVGIIESVLKLGVALSVVYLAGDKLVIYGVMMAGIPLVIMAIMRIYCHRKYEECVVAPRKYWDKKLMKEMRSFAAWNLLGSMSGVLSQSGTGILINIFHGTIANASQGIANQVSGQLGVLGSSIKKAITPIIAKSAGADNHELMVKTTVLGTKIILFVVTFMFLAFMIEMPFILKLWLKKPPQYAQIFCWLLLLTNFINDLVLFLPQAIAAIGKIKPFQMANSVFLFLPLLISYIAYSFGAQAYVIYAITAGVSLIQNFLVMYYADKLCNISFSGYFWNVIVRCTLAFGIVLVSGYILIHFLQEGFFRLCLTAVFTVAFYTVSFYFIGLNSEEKKNIRVILAQFVSKLNFNKRTLKFL
ncbi:MATE family efflux transporter [Mucilaginibacter sp. HD30]